MVTARMRSSRRPRAAKAVIETMVTMVMTTATVETAMAVAMILVEDLEAVAAVMARSNSQCISRRLGARVHTPRATAPLVEHDGKQRDEKV